MGENLDVLGKDDFLDVTPKAQSVKEIIDKINFIKIKNFLSERQCQGTEKATRLEENMCKKHLMKNCIQNI